MIILGDALNKVIIKNMFLHIFRQFYMGYCLPTSPFGDISSQPRMENENLPCQFIVKGINDIG